MRSTAPNDPKVVRFASVPPDPQSDQSTLDQFVARQVDGTIRQVVLSATAAIGQAARRHLAAAGTGASAGWAVWSYPVAAVPIAIAVIVYLVVVSR